MITIQDKTKCSGCHACAQVCPKQCIAMEVDTEGFWYPVVDTALCVECGLCETSCPILHPLVNNKTENDITAYAAVNKNEDIRLQSSSGGIFTLIASEVIHQGGVVFGAAFDKTFAVKHQYTETIDGLAAFRGSKYVQSRIGDTYKQAESFLKEGRTVLFTGTPCQIGGLLAYLKQDYDNLITQDIICHGVPSPMVWQSYIKYREKNAASATRRMYFRHKHYGWNTYSVLFDYANNTEYVKKHREDPYMLAFLNNLCLRPSCYDCSFKSKVRASDITLADFWGVQTIAPEMDDDKGTSLVFVNSKKGQQLFESIKNDLNVKPQDMDIAIQHNISMVESVAEPSKRQAFMLAVQTMDWDVLEKKFFKNFIWNKVYNYAKKIIKLLLYKY